MSIFRKKHKGLEEDMLIATCACAGGDYELNHALVFTLWGAKYGHLEGEILVPEMYAIIHLRMLGRSFWQRLVTGIKYICGRDCPEGAYGEWLLKTEDAKEIRGMFNKYLKMRDEAEKHRTIVQEEKP